MSDPAPPRQTLDYVAKPPPRDWQIGPKLATAFMFFVWLLVGGVAFVVAETVTPMFTPPRRFVAVTVRDSSYVLGRTRDGRQTHAELAEAMRLIKEHLRPRLRDRSAAITVEFGTDFAYLVIDSADDESAAAAAAVGAVGARIGSSELADSSIAAGRIEGSANRFARAAGVLVAGAYLLLTLFWLRRRFPRRSRA